MKKIFAIVIFALNLYANEVYEIDKNNSNVYFKAISDVLFFGSDTIIGINKDIDGELHIENKKLKGFIEISVDSFDTQNSKRDSHIKEILNYKEHQKISFLIKKELKKGADNFLDGVLKLNGVEKDISIKVEKSIQNNTITYKGKTSIKYSDFHIKPPSLAGFIKKAKDSIEIGAKIVFKRRNNGI